METLALTGQNFAAEVESAASTPILVYFWGQSCGFCRAMSPIIEQVRQERDSVKVAKVNAEEEMDLAARFNVRGLPALVFLKEGQVKDRHTGALSKKGVLQKLDALNLL